LNVQKSNGTIKPVYRQNLIAKTATQEQVAEHLINNGFKDTGIHLLYKQKRKKLGK
jgi:hypothetical protein